MLVIIVMVSCQKETIQPQGISSPSATDEYLQNAHENYEPLWDEGPKSGNILNATSSSQIPSQFFKAATKYKNAYVHVQQYSNECSWTSYTLAAGAIANGKGYTYNVNHTKITYVKNWCGSSYIERLYDFATQKDDWFLSNVYLSKEPKTSAGRFTTIKQMLYHIQTYKTPFPAIITHSGIGHYVVVWSIDWKCGGTGSTVYYTDPLDPVKATFDLQVKTMDYTTFLNKMGPNNPDVSRYCALFLR